MENIHPLISIIIPTKNRATLLHRSIKSVINQTYDNWECFIIDGKSTDNTKEIVNLFIEKEKRINYIINNSENTSASANRNLGASLSKGKYLAFLDDDDEWLPEKLKKQVVYFENLPDDVGLVYHWMDYYDNQHNLINSPRPILKGNIYWDILATDGNTGGTPTLLIKRKVFNEVNGFDENLKFYDDPDLVKRIAKNYIIEFYPEVLVNVFINHGFCRLSDDHKDALKSFIYIYEKYKTDLRKRRKIHSSYLAKLAYYYALNNNIKNSLIYIIKSELTFPFSIKKYRFYMRILKKIIQN